MSFLKSILTDKNTINEGNIVMFLLTFMVMVTDIVYFIKGLDIFVIMLVGIHLLTIFLLAKSEHSKLDVNKAVQVVGDVLKK
jgi:hypothetical protein